MQNIPLEFFFFSITTKEVENILTTLFPIPGKLLLLRCRTDIIYMKRTFIDSTRSQLSWLRAHLKKEAVAGSEV